MVLALLGSDLKAYILEAARILHAQHELLIADVIWFSSGTKTIFSQEGATKIKSRQFSEFVNLFFGQINLRL